MSDAIRVPAILASYRCGRTGMCCNMAWKVPVTARDRVSVEDRLQQVDAGPVLDRWRAALMERPTHTLLRQPNGRCTLLVEGPNCRLHDAGGLAALPSACRNFPRSVVRTPDGIEVAFTLGCPTAAGMVTRGVQPFAWREIAAVNWHWPPMDTCPDRVAWTRVADISYRELLAAREAWWAVLAAHVDDVSGPIAALLESPGEPAGRAVGAQDLGVAFNDDDIKAATLMLINKRHPRAPRYHEARRAIWRALTRPHDDAAIRATLGQTSPEASAALGILIQHAGVHVRRPATETLLVGTRRLLASVAIARSLMDALDIEPQTAMADGLTAGARLTSAGAWHQPAQGAA